MSDGAKGELPSDGNVSAGMVLFGRPKRSWCASQEKNDLALNKSNYGIETSAAERVGYEIAEWRTTRSWRGDVSDVFESESYLSFYPGGARRKGSDALIGHLLFPRVGWWACGEGAGAQVRFREIAFYSRI